MVSGRREKKNKKNKCEVPRMRNSKKKDDVDRSGSEK